VLEVEGIFLCAKSPVAIDRCICGAFTLRENLLDSDAVSKTHLSLCCCWLFDSALDTFCTNDIRYDMIYLCVLKI